MKKRSYILILDILAILIFVTTFSPLVTPINVIDPSLAGIPYTMWLGFLVSAVFVFLAYLVSIVNKENNNDH